MIRKRGIYLPDTNHDADHTAVTDEVNRWSDPVHFTVPAGPGTIVVTHGMGKTPIAAVQVATPTATGTGVVTGSTWNNLTVTLTATVAGDYAVIFRR